MEGIEEFAVGIKSHEKVSAVTAVEGCVPEKIKCRLTVTFQSDDKAFRRRRWHGAE